MKPLKSKRSPRVPNQSFNIKSLADSKRSQQEILGFVLIVVLVTIIGLVFLSFSIGKDRPKKQTSAEISNLLEAVMYYTTDCAINYVPQYREIQDLMKDCYNDPSQRCLSGNISCDVKDAKTKFSFRPTQGPWEHVAPVGTAGAPLLIRSGLKSGEVITITGVSGDFVYQGGNTADCNLGPRSGYGSGAIGGFYNDNKVLIYETPLNNFERGISTPSGATKLYAYIRESDYWKGWYHDNEGSCSFTVVGKSLSCDNFGRDKNVCEVLDYTLKNLIKSSLRVSEDSPNKAFRLKVYYNSSNNLQETASFIDMEEGKFTNCSSMPGGSHSIAITRSTGVINTELELCVGKV